MIWSVVCLVFFISKESFPGYARMRFSHPEWTNFRGEDQTCRLAASETTPGISTDQAGSCPPFQTTRKTEASVVCAKNMVNWRAGLLDSDPRYG